MATEELATRELATLTDFEIKQLREQMLDPQVSAAHYRATVSKVQLYKDLVERKL